ncbi:MAG: translation initiation factor IF-2 [Solirubrobacterales bacterium]|nr:translation initiation factor IF-2 [Solirubrobacterales bacterium]
MSKKRVHEIAKARGISSKEVIQALEAAGVSGKVAASSVEVDVAEQALKGAGGSAPAAKPKAAGSKPTKAKAAPKASRSKADKPKTGKARAATKPASGAAGPGAKDVKPSPAPRQGGSPDQKPPARPAKPKTILKSGSMVEPGSDRRQKPAHPASRPKPGAKPVRPGGAPGKKRRRVVIDSQASRREHTGGPPPQRPPRRRGGRRRKPVLDEPTPVTTDPEVPQATKVNSGITVRALAELLGLSSAELIKKLMMMGEMATLTQTLTDDSVKAIADEYSREIEIVSAAEEETPAPEFDDSDEELVDRPPVITIMGHVDHGKTSLLDAIRESEVAAGEAGGITQHIGAYQVHHGDHTITFLDTPGHEAFTAMRARGAQVTDVAVIVVAADDGVMPQTREAIDHARAADVPILIAVNKIDKEGAQPDRIRTELAGEGLNPEDWGGDTVYCDVSAKTRQGLENLLDMIILVTELEELVANPDAEASGSVIESQLDPGRGPVVSVLVQRGTLRIGDAAVAGPVWGKVRAMLDYRGEKVTEAVPGMPVEVLGFEGVCDAGEFVQVVENERRARQMAQERVNRLKAESIARRQARKVSLDEIFAQAQTGDLKELNIVLKSDVAGSLEALQDEIAKVPQEQVSINIIRAQTGGISESDVMLASASNAIIIGFNVRPLADARRAARAEGVDVRTYSVIYKITEELRNAMEGMLDTVEVEDSLGEAEVREVFKASKVGRIAGCVVTEGRIQRDASVRLVREGTVVWTGTLDSLRRFKDAVQTVEEGQDCGIVLDGYADVKVGDMLEFFSTRQVEQTLG